MDLSSKKIWAVIFIAAAAAGMFMLIWFLKPKADDSSNKVQQAETGIVLEEEGGHEAILEERQEINIPAAMKAVSIPVNFFGDPSVLQEGDRVDVISTYYREQEGSLYSEKIISGREIIRLEAGEIASLEDSSSGGFLTPDTSFAAGTAIDMGNIIVLTFFLTDDQVLEAFTALERGMLYLAVCPHYFSDKKGGS